MLELIYDYRHYLSLTALVLSLIGTLILIGKPTLRYFRGYVLNNPEIRQEIEDEAMGITFNRLSTGNREADLADSIARGFITTYKSTFFGFVLLFTAFLLQAMSTVSEFARRH